MVSGVKVTVYDVCFPGPTSTTSAPVKCLGCRTGRILQREGEGLLIVITCVTLALTGVWNSTGVGLGAATMQAPVRVRVSGGWGSRPPSTWHCTWNK
jgi:hypothetical protein